MKETSKIMLWSTERPALNPEKNFQPYMNTYLLNDGAEHGAVVIFPGGGYQVKMMTYEGEDVALRFNELGFHAFVVDYRCGRDAYPFPAPVEDALRAIKLVRGHAEEWKVRPDQIATLGFSAGGHLCCATAVWFDSVAAENGDEYDAVSARPDAVIPCYAVVSAFAAPCPHVGSFKNLLNTDLPCEADLHRLSCDEHVTPATPPAFLWHTVADAVVPYENALCFAEACRRNGVPFELHLFPYGPHGLGLGTQDAFAEVRSWPALCAEFLKKIPVSSPGR